MKGKILALGLISGDDGNRYTFEVSDIAHLKRRDPNKLVGCEVDFEVSEKAAKGIFITNSKGVYYRICPIFKDSLCQTMHKAFA